MLFSCRKTLLVTSGIIVAGGTAAAYLKSRNSSRRPESFGHQNGIESDKESQDKRVDEKSVVKKSRQKKGGLRSLKVLAAILLSHMGRIGARDFLSLVAIVVSASLSHTGRNGEN